MIEAGVPSTRRMLQHAVRAIVPVPPGVVMVAPIEVLRNAEEGRKAKAALSNRGGLEQRGKQHTHYKGGTP
jgi:hypothetical protein